MWEAMNNVLLPPGLGGSNTHQDLGSVPGGRWPALVSATQLRVEMSKEDTLQAGWAQVNRPVRRGSDLGALLLPLFCGDPQSPMQWVELCSPKETHALISHYLGSPASSMTFWLPFRTTRGHHPSLLLSPGTVQGNLMSSAATQILVTSSMPFSGPQFPNLYGESDKLISKALRVHVFKRQSFFSF